MNNKLFKWLVVSITIIISVLFASYYGVRRGTFYGDALGYYIYLPATFIYGNLAHVDSLPDNKNIPEGILNDIRTRPANQAASVVNGHFINQYTYGVALLEAPFFLSAHLYESVTGKDANGYSETYNYAIKLSAVVYAFLGMLICYKVVRRYFNENQSLIAVILILLGTNLFWFTLCQVGMSHVPLFFLYALLIYQSMRIHERPSALNFIIAGSIAGLITIIRPTDIICLIIPLLFNVYNKRTLKDKATFLKRNVQGLLIFALGFLIPLIPQLLYWNAYTGQFFYYSYGSQSFDWKHPKIIEGLFYFKNGWLPYSMVMIFSLLGLFCYRYIKPWLLCLLLVFPLYVYIIYSWYCYNYINGLGSRPMIHIYPLMILPLAAFIKFVSTRGPVIKVAFSIFCLFFISVNVSNSMQEEKNILFSEDSNMMFNIGTLYKMKLEYKDLVCMDNGERQPNANKIDKAGVLGCYNFNDSVSDHYVKNDERGSKYAYHLLGEEEYSPMSVNAVYNKKQFGEVQWLKCSGRFKCIAYPPYYGQHLLILSIMRNGAFVKWTSCKIDNKIGLAGDESRGKEVLRDHFELNKWGDVYFYVRLPQDIQEGDAIKLDIWNVGRLEMYMSNMCIELYK